MADGLGRTLRRMLGMEGQGGRAPASPPRGAQPRGTQPPPNRAPQNANRPPNHQRPPSPPPQHPAQRPPASPGYRPAPGQHQRPPANAAPPAQPWPGNGYAQPAHHQQQQSQPAQHVQQPYLNQGQPAQAQPAQPHPQPAPAPSYDWTAPPASAHPEVNPAAHYGNAAANEPPSQAPSQAPFNQEWNEPDPVHVPDDGPPEPQPEDPPAFVPGMNLPDDRDDDRDYEDDDDESWMYGDESDDLMAIDDLTRSLEDDLLPPAVRDEPPPSHDPLRDQIMRDGFDERNYSAPPFQPSFTNGNGNPFVYGNGQGGNLAMAGYGPGAGSVAAAPPIYAPPASNRQDQAWVAQQVLQAQNDNSGILWMTQALYNPMELYRQWRTFSRVFHNRTFDTWLKAIGAAVVTAGVFIGLLLWIAGSADNGDLPAETSIMLIIAGIMLGAMGGYWYWVKMVFPETYVKVMVMGRYNFVDASVCEDILIFHVQRLALANRPDVFVGNNGRNGIIDSQSYVRLKTTFGMFVSDICYPQQVYNLPKDDDGMQFAAATVRYDLYRMAETLGDLLAEFHTTAPHEAVAAFVSNNMPWFLSAGIFLVGVFILLQLFQ